MATLTFDQIAEIVKAHGEAEKARNAPAAVACDALEALREALAEMTLQERAEILGELYSLAFDFMTEPVAAT